MLVVLATALAFILLALMLIRPLWGVLLLWPMLFWYPHALTEALLPLNIGFDDVYIFVLFVMTILRRTQSGQSMRFGVFGCLALAFWFLFIIGELYSILSIGIVELVPPLLKGILKNSSLLMVGLTVLNSVDSLSDVVRLVRWYLVGAIGLSVLAILQYFYPYTVAPFYHSDIYAPGEAVLRATGTTKGPWELGAVLGIAIVMAFSVLTLSRGAFSRPLAGISGALSIVAIILSTSRAGWLLTCLGVLVVLLYGKRPLLGLVIVGLFAFAVTTFPMLTETITHRVDYTFKAGQLDSSSTTRIEGWQRMLGNIKMAGLLTGLGTLATYLDYRMTPHNYYLAVLLQFGLAGVIYFIILAVSLIRRSLANIRSRDGANLTAVWKGIVAANFGIAAYSMVADTLNSALVGQAVFYFWAMLYVRPYVVTADEESALAYPETYQTDYGEWEQSQNCPG